MTPWTNLCSVRELIDRLCPIPHANSNASTSLVHHGEGVHRDVNMVETPCFRIDLDPDYRR